MNDPNQWILYLLLVFFLALVLIFYIILHIINMAELPQLIVLLVSGFIQLYAGLFLFKRTSWDCFVNVKGILALVPTMMDLKGNVEISLASRISTLANTTEKMKSFHSTKQILKQNVILIQCQVVIIALFSVMVTSIYVQLKERNLTFNHVLLITAIALSTATIACSILGSIMTIVISLISRSGYDPDDVATSIAASIGDFTTIVLIVVLANFFYEIQSKSYGGYITWVVIGVILLIFPFVLYYTIKTPELKTIIIYSGPAIIISTFISLFSGFIFESSGENFNQITLLLPMFSGFVGNSISIIVSLISTTLQRINLKKDDTEVKFSLSFKDVFINYEYNEKVSKTCRSHLIHGVVPCQFAYLLTLRITNGEEYIKLTICFTALYLFMSIILLIFMIYLSCNMTHMANGYNLDPCETVIPITTSITDFFGSLIITLFFYLLKWSHDPNIQIKSTELLEK